MDIIRISMVVFMDRHKCPLCNYNFAIATFGTKRTGIFLSLSAQNNGPKASKMVNVVPWVTTIGAAKVDPIVLGEPRP